MRARKFVLPILCVLATVGTLVLHRCSRGGLENLGVDLVTQTTNGSGVRIAVLQLTNQGPYRICCPDSCSVQSRDASKWVYTPTTNLWLEPGATVRISIPAPDSAADWRAAVGYYPETPWNRLKMRLGTSALASGLPPPFVSVKGAEAWSPWITR